MAFYPEAFWEEKLMASWLDQHFGFAMTAFAIASIGGHAALLWIILS